MPASEKKTRPRQTGRTGPRRGRGLFADGQLPTVAAVAERATWARAYRYFPTQEALLVETTFLGDSETLRGLPEHARDSDTRPRGGGGRETRSRVDTRARGAAADGPARLARPLRPDAPAPARRRGYIEALLEPLADQLSPAANEHLTGALTLLFRIDPNTGWPTTDVPRERIPDVLAWTARRLVDAALAESAR